MGKCRKGLGSMAGIMHPESKCPKVFSEGRTGEKMACFGREPVVPGCILETQADVSM